MRRDDPRRGGPAQQGPRVNQHIRVRQIRVIDEEGQQLGVLETADALALALRKGLDLVEIAPTQRPPVCRIMDFGKYKYELKKKEQASRKKQHHVQVKVRQARQFLEEGDKVQVNCLFRGREMAHREVGQRVMMHVFELLQDIAKIERDPQMEGRRMVMLLTKK